MSQDGRFVAFQSAASNLVTGVNGGQSYVRDTCNGAPSGCIPSTMLASVSTSGVEGNQNSNTQAISGTGEFVVFLSYATNMVPNETTTPGWFWRDTCLGGQSGCSPSTIRADVSTSGTQPNQAAFSASLPAITPDGRLEAFGSGATNLVAANFCTNANGCGNVFVRDTCTGAAPNCAPSTSLVSVGNDGSIGNCFDGGSPGNLTNVSISSDGRFVSFGSISTNLTPDDTLPACGGEDIFVRDTCFGVASGCVPSTVRVSVPALSVPNVGQANGISVGNAMSADGHYVVFISTATNMLPGVTGNGHAMVFLAKTGF